MRKEDETSDNSLAKRNPDQNIIQLGQGQSLDLSSFPEDVQIELRKEYAKGAMELAKKAAELGIEAKALDVRLENMSGKISNATTDGASATITGSYDDSMGRTEVIMGNTEAAAKGKLDRSQKGEKDMTVVYVILAVVAVLILASIMSK
jgi:hypothetical protein